MQSVSDSPPRAPPIKYTAPLGTRWAKEKAAAGGAAAFDLPTDPKCIGPWILGECVGKGASGRVKIAKHRRTGQLAAVKILPIAPLVNSRASLATQQAKSDKQRLGIDREITMMKLMNHPNIMRIYDYVEGGELFDFLVNRGRLPPNEALIYFRQIVYGLNYAHTFSIIHRDLKPENILIASLSPPQLKIADWGMAAFAPPSLQLETSCGSPHYASPEIVNGEKYEGNATDIWSCGVILYALLTGRLPFDDKNVRTLLSKVKSGKYEMPTWIDPLAKDLLSKMLIVDVKQRITIPEILSHPWLVAQPNIPFSASDGSTYTLLAPPLPPSPTILGRPIMSPDLIDPELFSSLRIIWGRHTDPEGNSIQRDLCAPAGQGIHAKAFYFLLAGEPENIAVFEKPVATSSATPAVSARAKLSLGVGRGGPRPLPRVADTRTRPSRAERTNTPAPWGSRSIAAAPGADNLGLLAQAPILRPAEPHHVCVAEPGADMLPLLTAPRMENPQIQRTMNDITQKAPSVPGHGESKEGAKAVAPHYHGGHHHPKVQEDKENEAMDEDSWSHVNADPDRSGYVGLGVGVGANRDAGGGNAGATTLSPTKSRKEKEKKGRPPPLELPSFQKRSAFGILGSPIALASPLHHPPSSANRILASPVVGEFKGWFSNLFNWKHSNGHGGVLYSNDDITHTRANVARLLENAGITLANTPTEIIFCRIDQPIVDPATGASMKSVRFRVEFRASPGGGPSEPSPVAGTPISEESPHFLAAPPPANAGLLATPNPANAAARTRTSILLGRGASAHAAALPSPSVLARWEFPPGCACALAVVHEKGSVSTFKAVWRRLKEEYGEAGTAAYPCFSPAMPNTPYAESQRMVM
ncbi:Pkinase-domain-containing protein [Pholiota molesta]|nr:Pkinase-domain-containing protein [Pholiota molesta]